MSALMWPLVFSVVGACVFTFVPNAAAKEMGRISFAVGLLWLVYFLTTNVALRIG